MRISAKCANYYDIVYIVANAYIEYCSVGFSIYRQGFIILCIV